jgi:hypothetical protein
MDVLHQLEKATVADVLREPKSACTYTLFIRHYQMQGRLGGN